MKKLLVSMVVCLTVLATAVGVLVIQDRNRMASAINPFSSLGPWPLEVLKQGRNPVLSYGVRFRLPSTSGGSGLFDWTPGATLRAKNSGTRIEEVAGFAGLDGEKAQILFDASDNTILGVKECPFYALSPDSKKAALVYPQAILIIGAGDRGIVATPHTIGGKAVAEYCGNIPQNPYVFCSPTWSADGGKLAFRSRLNTDGISPGYSIWVYDIAKGSCRVLREGQSQDQINAVYGWMDGRILFLDPTVGVGLLSTEDGETSILTKSTVNQLVVSPSGKAAVGVDVDGNFDLVLLRNDGTLSRLSGLAEGEKYSYGACWSPDATRLAFIISAQGPEETYLAIAEQTVDGIKVVRKCASPDPEHKFPADGPLSWADDESLVVYTESRTNRFQAKSWLLSVPGKAGKPQ